MQNTPKNVSQKPILHIYIKGLGISLPAISLSHGLILCPSLHIEGNNWGEDHSDGDVDASNDAEPLSEVSYCHWNLLIINLLFQYLYQFIFYLLSQSH